MRPLWEPAWPAREPALSRTNVAAVPLAPYEHRRLRTPVEHAAVLHPGGQGKVILAMRPGDGRWIEQSLTVQDLPYAVRQLAGKPDVYIAQNRFFGPRRLVARLAELNALFVDLDFHRTEHAGQHPQHVLELALDALEVAHLPSPSFAVSTGRGLALVWLHRPVPRAALPRWRACQLSLCQALRVLGADRLATDAARVLRLVGTVNSRSGTLVEAILPVGQVWDFDALADEVLPLERAELVALRLERARRRARHGRAARPTRYFTAASLWELRLAELQRLREHRWFGSLPDGQRDVWMLLAGTAISYLVPSAMVHREITALAKEVTGGAWDEREVASRMSSVIARAEQAARGERVLYEGKLIDPRYRFKTATIIELLGITEAEIRACDLRHLVTPELARERHRLVEQQRRRALGAVPRQDYEAGALSCSRPWEALGINRRTWERRRARAAGQSTAAEEPPT